MHAARQLVRDVVADNLRAARAGSRLNQEDVARRMRGLGFDTWSRATVSEVERRRRGVGVEELVALAVIFESQLATLVQPRGRRPDTFEDLASGGKWAGRHREGLAAHAVESVLSGEVVWSDWEGNDHIVGVRSERGGTVTVAAAPADATADAPVGRVTR